jgi:predicted DNA-binding transcriptional regulator AlpA
VTTPSRFTTTEVCALARLSRATLWRRIAAGRLPAPIDRGREALFDADAIAVALCTPAPAQARPDPLAAELRLQRWAARATSRRTDSHAGNISAKNDSITDILPDLD